MDEYHSPFVWNSLSQCKDSSNGPINTALCLNSHAIVDPSHKNWCNKPLSSDNGVSLALGLGYSQMTAKSNCGPAEREQFQLDMSLDLDLSFGTQKSCQELRNTSPACMAEGDRGTPPKIDLELSLSAAGGATTESDVTSVTLASSPVLQNSIQQLVDEGSTSSKWKKCLIVPTTEDEGMMTMSLDLNSNNIVSPVSVLSDAPSFPTESPRSSSAALRPPRKSAVKTCQFPGCAKGARGASGRCISHGGGRRCQRTGCQKGAEGRTAFCKAHGGGRRCEHLGCTKSAEGRTNFCIGHGGGRRCTFEGCPRAARGRSGLCIRHGGGKRCRVEGCTKSAEGLAGLCIAHGGGRRCQFPQCTKGAQGSTKFCKAHGGGKRCAFPGGCSKGAEGSTPFCKAHGGGKRCTFEGGCTKSVHGGTLFCVSHGGGKRCAFPGGCTKSARGRTSFCVRHGGGKRCRFEGCGKSAQGSTDFCKAHGGGKRCLWGQPGSGDHEGQCDKFARGKIGLCAAHAAQVQDKRVHGNGTVGLKMKEAIMNIPNPTLNEPNPSVWPGFDFGGSTSTMQGVTVPSNSFFVCESSGGGGGSSFGSLPEGRVHGGSLMAMLRAGVGFGEEAGTSHGLI